MNKRPAPFTADCKVFSRSRLFSSSLLRPLPLSPQQYTSMAPSALPTSGRRAAYTSTPFLYCPYSSITSPCPINPHTSALSPTTPSKWPQRRPLYQDFVDTVLASLSRITTPPSNPQCSFCHHTYGHPGPGPTRVEEEGRKGVGGGVEAGWRMEGFHGS